MHQTITRTGAVVYRTKLLTVAQAAAFAACLTANESRFTEVGTARSERAKGEADHFVTYRPVSVQRQADLIAHVQGERADRAANEGAAYEFMLDKDGGRPFWWVFNPVSGETYEVTPECCSCPDYTFRCQRAGLSCKHMVTLQDRLREGGGNTRN